MTGRIMGTIEKMGVRPTEGASEQFRHAKESTSSQDIMEIAYGLEKLATAVGQVYDKLNQIERLIRSQQGSSLRRPKM